MAVLGTLEYLITVNSSKLSSGIKQSEGAVKGYGNRLSSWAVAKGQMISRFAERAVSSVARFAKGSVIEAMSFDKAMSQVAATMGKSTDEIGELRDFARKMGAETAYSATEAAEALNYMALAGYDSKTAMSMLPNVLNLAAAGNFDLASASDMVTDAQSALGLTLAQTRTMVDQMAVASSKTNTSVAQLGEAFLTVGGTAKDMKGGTKELSAVLGVLADNGIKGAEGGTALRNILLSLQGKSSKAAKELKALGISAYDAGGELRSIPDIIMDFNKAFEGRSTQERNSAFMKIFNARDLKSVNALLGTTAKRWDEIFDALDDSSGAAERMANTQLDNLAGDTTKFKSALGEAKIAISDVLQPALRKFVQNGTKLVQQLTTAFKEGGLSGAVTQAKSIIVNFIEELKASDNPVLVKVGEGLETLKNILNWIEDNQETIITAVSAIIAAFAAAKIAAFVTSLNPVVLILGAIAGAATLVATHWEVIKGTLIKIWDSIKTAVENAWTAVSQWTEDISGKIEAAWGSVTSFFSGLWRSIMEGAINAWASVAKFWGDITSKISGAWGTIATWFDTNIWTPIKTAVQAVIDVISGLWDGIVGKVQAGWEGVKEALEPILAPIKTLFEGLVNTVSGIWNTLSSIFGLGNKSINVDVNYTEHNRPSDFNYSPGRSDSRQSYGGGGSRMNTRYDALHAKGSWGIPYDNYPALLHRGEMVLTASQARKYKGGGGGVDYGKIGEMIGEAVDSSIGRVGVYLSGNKVADMTSKRTKRNINADTNSRLRSMGG